MQISVSKCIRTYIHTWMYAANSRVYACICSMYSYAYVCIYNLHTDINVATDKVDTGIGFRTHETRISDPGHNANMEKRVNLFVDDLFATRVVFHNQIACFFFIRVS